MKIFKTHQIWKSKYSRWIFRIAWILFILGIVGVIAFTFDDTMRVISTVVLVLGVVAFVVSALFDMVVSPEFTHVDDSQPNNVEAINKIMGGVYGFMPEVTNSGKVDVVDDEDGEEYADIDPEGYEE